MLCSLSCSMVQMTPWLRVRCLCEPVATFLFMLSFHFHTSSSNCGTVFFLDSLPSFQENIQSFSDGLALLQAYSWQRKHAFLGQQSAAWNVLIVPLHAQFLIESVEAPAVWAWVCSPWHQRCCSLPPTCDQDWLWTNVTHTPIWAVGSKPTEVI